MMTEIVFSAAQALTGTSDVNSTNVYDAGSAKKLFQGSGQPVKVSGVAKCTGGTSPTFRARFVGADDAALTSNVVILADTGATGVLTSGDRVPFELTPSMQTASKRYYGVIYLDGGTAPTITVSAALVASGQTNQVEFQAAVPAT